MEKAVSQLSAKTAATTNSCVSKGVVGNACLKSSSFTSKKKL